MIAVRFVGSYPTAAFALTPALPEIAVIGRSNVGKSSLINVLTGRRAVARTSQTPGKTRLCNVFAIGERYYLLDLPGYGFARVGKAERAQLGRLLKACLTERSLAGVLWLLDLRHQPSRDDHAMQALLGDTGRPVLAVLTKADKVARARRGERLRAIQEALTLEDEQCVVTSAETRDGVADLRDAVDGLVAGGVGA